MINKCKHEIKAPLFKSYKQKWFKTDAIMCVECNKIFRKMIVENE